MADIVTPRDLSNELVTITNDATLFEIYNPDQSRNEKVQMSTLLSYVAASELATLTILGETILARDGGNVGIGVSDPHSKLEINGAMSSGQSTIITDTDALDVAGVNSVLCNTIDNSITIGGLANGVTGQVVRLIKIHANNNLIIEHLEGSGTQKIITPDQADITLTTYGGVTLVYDGAFWMVVSE